MWHQTSRLAAMLLRYGRDSDALDLRARHRRFVRRFLPEVGRFLPRPAPVDGFLEWPAKNQNDENECSTQHDDLPLGDCASRTDTGGHPDTGCCRQPMDVMTFAISDNNACAQKTDSGHDTLDNTTRVGAADRVDR